MQEHNVMESGPRLVNFDDYGSKEALDEAFGDKWIYIGREDSEFGLPASHLGNPFTIEDHGREKAVELYQGWLNDELESAEPGSNCVLDALLEINEDSVLVCWCVPKSCHGEIVCEAWIRWHE